MVADSPVAELPLMVTVSVPPLPLNCTAVVPAGIVSCLLLSITTQFAGLEPPVKEKVSLPAVPKTT